MTRNDAQLSALKMISATTVWAHQVALNTDRYVEVVGPVAADPDVIEEVSTRLAGRISDGIVDRVDVPQFVKPLLEGWLQEQIAKFMSSEAFADGWAAANRAAHSAWFASSAARRSLVTSR